MFLAPPLLDARKLAGPIAADDIGATDRAPPARSAGLAARPGLTHPTISRGWRSLHLLDPLRRVIVRVDVLERESECWERPILGVERRVLVEEHGGHPDLGLRAVLVGDPLFAERLGLIVRGALGRIALVESFVDEVKPVVAVR